MALSMLSNGGISKDAFFFNTDNNLKAVILSYMMMHMNEYIQHKDDLVSPDCCCIDKIPSYIPHTKTRTNKAHNGI